MKLTTVRVQVAGKNYQLAGVEDEEHIAAVARLADRRIRETSSADPSLGAEASAVAAALSLADDLIKAQSLATRLRAELETIQQQHEEG